MQSIEEHQKIVGSRFQLARIIMKRTNELIKGAPIAPEIARKFTAERTGSIPNQSLHQVALEELRCGKLAWERKDAPSSIKDQIANDQTIFGA